MATLDWNGGEILARVTAASTAAVQETMEACVDDARADHPDFPPESEPFERYANRAYATRYGLPLAPHQQTESINVLDDASFDGATVKGSWGSLNRYALYLEIGTSWHDPRAEERAAMDGGDPHLVPPASDPKMFPRPYLLPALDREYPKLIPRIRDKL